MPHHESHIDPLTTSTISTKSTSRSMLHCQNRVYVFGENLSTTGWSVGDEAQDVFDEIGYLRPMNSRVLEGLWENNGEIRLEEQSSSESFASKNVSTPQVPFHVNKVCAGFKSIALLSDFGECRILRSPQDEDFANLDYDTLHRNYYIEDVSCGYRHCILTAVRKTQQSTPLDSGVGKSLFGSGFLRKLLGRKTNIDTSQHLSGDSKNSKVLIAIGSNLHHQCGFTLEEIENSNFFEIKFPLKSNPMPEIISVACGYHHTLFLMSDNSIWMSGRALLHENPDRPHHFGYYKFTISNVKIVHLAAGYLHNIAITDNGSVYTWGKNSSGQLGLGDVEFEDSPTLVKALQGHHIVSASAGYTHSIFLSSKGLVFTCGDSVYGRIGRRTDCSIPKVVQLNGPATSISAGGYHSLIAINDGSVYAMGHSGFNQCGVQMEKGKYYSQPSRVKVPDSENIVGIAAGGYHSVLLHQETPFSRGRKLFFSKLITQLDNRFADVDVYCQE